MLDSTVVFSEIMYNPAGATDDTHEFIELHNQLAVDMDLSEWELDGAVDFTFPDGTIIPGRGYLVVAADPDSLGVAALGPWTGSLDNSGEEIRLMNNDGRNMNTVEYNDKGDWPVGPDGSGVSLAKLGVKLASEPFESWGTSSQIGGTPGVANSAFAEGGSLVLNEFESSLETDFWLELHNSGSGTMNLAGVTIVGTGLPGGEYTFGAGAEIIGGDYLVVTEAELGFQVDAEEKVFLYSSAAKTELLDAHVVRDHLRGRSDRYDGEWHNPDVGTPGAVNSFAFQDDIVINEIMYHIMPQFDPFLDDHEEWIELYNRGPAAVDLTGWVIEDAVRFDFAPGTTLGSGEYMVVAGDAAALAAKYPAIDIAGEFSGSLSNREDRIRLVDEFDNPADDVHYFDAGQWAEFADGGGSSLELRDPDSDNSKGAAWAASDEASKSEWNDYTVSGTANEPLNNCCQTRNALVIGLLDSGEFLIDDVSVLRNGAEVLSNGTFDNLSGWETIGNHAGAAAEPLDLEFLLEDQAPVRALVPSDGALGQTWIEPGFNDNSWLSGNTGVGYDDNTNYDPHISLDVTSQMDGVNQTIYMRVPFAVDAGLDLADVETLVLGMKYDDAFVAYLNGTEVARSSNTPGGTPAWNAGATGTHDDGAAVNFDFSFNITANKNLLNPGGTNVLAIHGLNSGLGSSDFLISPAIGYTVAGEGGEDPTDGFLHVIAHGAQQHLHDHVRAALTQSVNGQPVTLSFRAKWLGGNSQLTTRFDFTRMPNTFLLETPELLGTPGAVNSRLAENENIGPTYENFGHSPVLPSSSQSVTVTVDAEDSDGVASMKLFWNINGGAATEVVMSGDADGRYTGTIPAQGSNQVVQFWVEGEDGAGVTSTFPADGVNSRALYQVNNSADGGNREVIRLVMLTADNSLLFSGAERMSNNYYGGTMIRSGQEAFYDIDIRQIGSRFIRPNSGYKVKLNPEHKFYGVHGSIRMDTNELDEILMKQLVNRAGGSEVSMYDDVATYVTQQRGTGTMLLNLARYEGIYLDEQFGSRDGTKWELDDITYDNGSGVSSQDMFYRGADPENYRGQLLIKNNRAKDDFAPLVDFTYAIQNQDGLGQSQAWVDQLNEVIDVDIWMRHYATQAFVGNWDTWGFRRPKNLRIFTRPEDGKVIPLFWDADLGNWSDSLIYNGGETVLDEIRNVPSITRLFWGHMWDLTNRAFNQTYATYWSSHYSSFGAGAASAGTVGGRANQARSQAMSTIPVVQFSITTNGGNPLTVDTTSIDLVGDGWIDVREIHLVDSNGGVTTPLDVTWTDQNSWTLRVPLEFGSNTIELEAFDFEGNSTGTDSITITSTNDERPLRDNLRISELHFNPPGNDDNSGEFIELVNIAGDGGPTLDLNGVVFTDGIDFDFTGSAVTSLAPGERVVVVRNMAAFEAAYDVVGDEIQVAGEYLMGLDNGGERIILRNADNVDIHNFFYDDWYPETDGGGFSLNIEDTIADLSQWDLEAGWRVSQDVGGSPGLPDGGVSPGDILFNEILVNAASAGGEWIELRNTTDELIDISGWFLSDDGVDAQKFTLTTGSEIPANGFLVLTESSGFGLGFTLSETGGEIHLRSGNTEGEVTGFHKSLAYGGAETDMTFGLTDTTSGAVYAALATPTEGAANSGPSVAELAINEIMYFPEDGSVEFIELKNTSGDAIVLNDGVNAWQFVDGIDYAFPVGAAPVPAGGFVVLIEDGVAADDVGAFRAAHGGLAGVDVYVYTPVDNGKLENGGERLALARPGQTVAAPVVVEVVNYDNNSPWPFRPGLGIDLSLSSLDATAFGNDAVNWGTGIEGGTPGAENQYFDTTPPTVPTGLSFSVAAGPQVTIEWAPSTDPDGEVREYVVYRDDSGNGAFQEVARTSSTSFTQSVFVTSYDYQVSAVNTSGVESAASVPLDVRLFGVTSAFGLDQRHVRLSFTEEVEESSAENTANYLVGGAPVLSAVLEVGNRSVLLETSFELEDSVLYAVLVNDINSVSGAIMPPGTLAEFTPGVTLGALKAEYFNNTLLSGVPVLTRIETAETIGDDVMFNRQTGDLDPPDPSVNADNYSVRWSGMIHPVFTGDYMFTTQADDHVKLTIDVGEPGGPTVVLNEATSGSDIASNSGDLLFLNGGQPYPFEVEFKEFTGSAVMRMLWQSFGQATNQPSEFIPTSVFSTGGSIDVTPPTVTDLSVASTAWSGGGYSIPVGDESQLDPLAWNNLDQVKIEFSDDVDVVQGDLTLTDVNDVNYGFASFNYDSGSSTAIWTLDRTIGADRLTLNLADSVVDQAGNALDGEWEDTVSVYDSGDGTAGGAFQFSFNVLPGDLDRDNEVTRTDVSMLVGNLGVSSGATIDQGDLDGDGQSTLFDLGALLTGLGDKLPQINLPGAIVINEVMADGAGGDFIELTNTTGTALDISGWFISDDAGSLMKYQVPENTPLIQPGGFHVFDEGQLGFDFSRTGGEASVSSTGGIGGVTETVTMAGADADVSFGRYINSAGDIDFVATSAPSPNAANPAPAVPDVIFNEILYNPASGDEFIELYNRGGSDVTLFDPAQPANTWKFTAGITFDFPAGVTLDSDDYLLVVPTSPAAFRAAHPGVPAGVQVFGPYDNSLSDSGERLELSRPDGPTVPYIVNERVQYDDASPWQTLPDGNGPSLARSDAGQGQWGNEPANWDVGAHGGTPGAFNLFEDATPPTMPTGLSIDVNSGTQLTLNWSPSSDPDSAVESYAVYRSADGGGFVQIGSSATTSFADSGVVLSVDYSYQVTALNTSQVESTPSTPQDIRLFGVAVATPVDADHVRLSFTEAVEASSAENAANYLVGGASVTTAVLEAGSLSVLLTTSITLEDGVTYAALANNVTATSGALLPPDSQDDFTPGLTFEALTAEYFNNSTLTGPAVLTRVETADIVGAAMFNRIWSDGDSPDPLVNDNNFSVRWSGSITPEFSELYTFRTQADDNVKLTIDVGAGPVTVINETTSGQDNAIGSINLTAGQDHPFVVEFKEFTGNASMRMLWASASLTTEFIPTSAFTSGAGASPAAAPAAVQTSPAVLASDELISLPSRSGREDRFAPRHERAQSRPLRFDPAVIDVVLEDRDATTRASRRARRPRAHRAPRTALQPVDATE